MLILNSTNNLKNCACTGTTINTTGFGTVSENKFIYENIGRPSGSYKLSNGILFTIVYQEVNGKVTLFSENETFQNYIVPTVPKTNFSENVKPVNYKITNDGIYYVLDLFIVSKNFYDMYKTSEFNSNDPILYFDELNKRLVYTYNGQEMFIANHLDLIMFLHSESSVETIQGVIINETTEFSICNLLYCYHQLVSGYLDKSLGYDPKRDKYKCPNNCIDGVLNTDLMFLRHTIATLNYLMDCEYYDDAQRIMDLISKCGNICAKYKTLRNDNCGC